MKYGESDAWGGGAYNAVEQRATIAFTGDLASLPKWDQALMALVLYYDHETQEWVIVATTTSCRLWNERGEPTPPYWEFRLRDRAWREVSLSAGSIARRANLFTGDPEVELHTKYVTVGQRTQYATNPMIAKMYLEVRSEVQDWYCPRATPRRDGILNRKGE